MPSIASFVGADTVAVILATRLHESRVPRLAIDIGTNGEVMLATKKGSPDRLHCGRTCL
jgi:uncharacterized 2Fe-2S/4Fe-4S cluster protein (DUF4445 family)